MANIKAIKKLQKFLLAKKGRTYEQTYWLFGKDSAVVLKQKPLCGTAGCLAGNACMMNGFIPAFYSSHSNGEFSRVMRPRGRKSYDVERLAIDILDLTVDQASDLFDEDCGGWSVRAKRAYDSAKTPLEKAKAACMALDDFVEEDKQSSREQ
jgi:hypothetical protein